MLGHVNEYPSMHYFGTPRHSQSMIALKIWTKYFWKFQWKFALWECYYYALLVLQVTMFIFRILLYCRHLFSLLVCLADMKWLQRIDSTKEASGLDMECLHCFAQFQTVLWWVILLFYHVKAHKNDGRTLVLLCWLCSTLLYKTNISIFPNIFQIIIHQCRHCMLVVWLMHNIQKPSNDTHGIQ